MTLSEYEADFQSKMQYELKVFKDSLKLVSSVPGADQFIVDLCSEVETPFITLGGDFFEAVVDANLKT